MKNLWMAAFLFSACFGQTPDFYNRNSIKWSGYKYYPGTGRVVYTTDQEGNEVTRNIDIKFLMDGPNILELKASDIKVTIYVNDGYSRLIHKKVLVKVNHTFPGYPQYVQDPTELEGTSAVAPTRVPVQIAVELDGIYRDKKYFAYIYIKIKDKDQLFIPVNLGSPQDVTPGAEPTR